MKRFAVEKDREFEIAGEVFNWVYPYWEDIAVVFDEDSKIDENGSGPNVHATIAEFIERIQLFIDPEQHDRWVALSKRRKNPIPHSQFAELYRWLLETTSSPTPTEPSLPSEPGQPNTEATSTEG